MSTEPPAYGLWLLVLINSAVFIIFAFSFAHPRTARDWRSFGAFAGFLVALFTEWNGWWPSPWMGLTRRIRTVCWLRSAWCMIPWLWSVLSSALREPAHTRLSGRLRE